MATAGRPILREPLLVTFPTGVSTELDLFVHDNLAFAGRLLRAGCKVEAHLYPGAIHGFDRMVEAEVSRRYTRELCAFIARLLT